MNGSIVFPHIIKTGGSTVSSHLLKHMQGRYHHVEYDISGRPAIENADQAEDLDLIGVTRLLESYWFVTTTEHLDDDLPMIFTMLGVPTKCSRERVAGVFDRWDNTQIPKRHSLSFAEREQIAQDHPGDMELYQLALSLRTTRRNSDAGHEL